MEALLAALPLLDTDLMDAWGERLGDVLVGGGRLLVAGNGGSAAQAQHLTAELVGRYRDDRPALSAIALHAETSAVTAISNDYGYDHVFARQVQAHGRPGDVFLGMSTSGRSGNILAAMDAAREGGLTVWAMTGAGPNPMVDAADEALHVPAPATATVQEIHQIALHLVCAAVDLRVGPTGPPPGWASRTRPRRERSAGRRRRRLLDRDLVGSVDRLSPTRPCLSSTSPCSTRARAAPASPRCWPPPTAARSCS